MYASTDLALSTISINTGTGALTFTPASTGVQPAWVLSATSVLTAVNYTAGAKTITPSLPASTKYAVIGVEIDTTGAITLVKGADTSTQLNTGILIAANTPATSSGKLRIADFAVWNNAGTINFSDHTTTATQGTNWIDRRPWARALHAQMTDPSNSAVDNTLTTSVWNTITNFQMRVECSGNPIHCLYNGQGYGPASGSTPTQFGVRLLVDGAATTLIGQTVVSGDTRLPFTSAGMWLPSAGSHLVQLQLIPDVASCRWTGQTQVLTLLEQPKPFAGNGAA